MGLFSSFFKSNIENLEPAQFKAKIEDKGDQAVILDVRTMSEINSGAIEDHVHMDFYNDFGSKIESLDPAKHYFVYCRSGNRSSQACQMLKDRGINGVSNLSGGYMAWSRKYD